MLHRTHSAAAIAAVVGIPLALSLGTRSQGASVVTAREIVLADESGRVGMRIAFDTDGRPVLRLYDRDGVERASLGVRPGSDPAQAGQTAELALNDARGRRTVSLAHVDEPMHGDLQGLTYFKGDRRPYMGLVTDSAFAGGGAELGFYGSEGDHAVRLGAGPLGQEPHLSLRAPARAKGDKRGVRSQRVFHVDTSESAHPPFLFRGDDASLTYDFGGDDGPSCLRLADRRATPLLEKVQE